MKSERRETFFEWVEQQPGGRPGPLLSALSLEIQPLDGEPAQPVPARELYKASSRYIRGLVKLGIIPRAQKDQAVGAYMQWLRHYLGFKESVFSVRNLT